MALVKFQMRRLAAGNQPCTVVATTGTTTTNGGSMYGVWGYSENGDVTITADRTITLRIEVRETDGTVFTDIITPSRRRAVPEPPGRPAAPAPLPGPVPAPSTAGVAMAPRTLVRSEDLAQSGLIASGTLFETEYRLMLPQGAELDAMRSRLMAAMPAISLLTG